MIGEGQDTINIQEEFSHTASRTQLLFRKFTITAVSIDALYSVFMWESVQQAISKAYESFGKEISPEMQNYVRYFATPLIIVNLICDMTSVDAARGADELYFALQRQEQNKQKIISKLVFAYTLQLLAFLTSYPVGASADAIPVADFVDKEISDETVAAIIRYGSLGFIACTGTLYYMLFTNPRIKRHVSEFVDAMKNLRQFGTNLIRHPARYLEITLQSSFNAIYRGVSFSFIMNDLVEKFSSLNPNSTLSRSLSAASGLSSGLISLFSRHLSVRDEFLNSNYALITPAERNRTNGLSKALVLDLVLSVVRGGSLGVLANQVLPLAYPWNYIAPGVVGLAVASHSAYVRYQNRWDQNALALISSEKLRKRKQALESTPLLPDSTRQNERMTAEYKEKCFDKLVAQKISPRTDLVIGAIALTTQLVRFIAFYLFVDSINLIYDLGLSPVITLALTFLWGSEVFKNDSALYRGAMQQTWGSYAARWELEKKEEEHAEKNARLLSNFTGTFFRPIRAVLKSPYDYPVAQLEEAVQSIKGQSELDAEDFKQKEEATRELMLDQP